MEVAGKPFSRNMADAFCMMRSFLDAFIRFETAMLKDNEQWDKPG
jgi:hypothetical protein